MFRQFYLYLDANRDFCEAPRQFYGQFASQIPDEVILFDSAGSLFGISFLKLFGCGFFTIGLRNIINHYGFSVGGWLEVLYVGGPVFSIKVRNMMLQEVNYPNAASYLEFN